jgi:hypothetical protein
VFNAAVDLSVGGLNANNLGQFGNDLKAVAAGVPNVINNPGELKTIEAGETATPAALTTLQLHRTEDQLQLQINTVDGLCAPIPTRRRAKPTISSSTSSTSLTMMPI